MKPPLVDISSGAEHPRPQEPVYDITLPVSDTKGIRADALLSRGAWSKLLLNFDVDGDDRRRSSSTTTLFSKALCQFDIFVTQWRFEAQVLADLGVCSEKTVGGGTSGLAKGVAARSRFVLLCMAPLVVVLIAVVLFAVCMSVFVH